MSEERKVLWILKRFLLVTFLFCSLFWGLIQSADAANISGRVFQDINNNSMNDIDSGIDIGVTGIRVKLTHPNGTEETTITGAGGAYSFNVASDGIYEVEVDPVGNPSQFNRGASLMPTVAGGVNSPNQDLAIMGNKGGIQGTVFTDTNMNLNFDSGESPLNSTSLQAELWFSGVKVSTVDVTGGRYYFNNLDKTGNYIVRIISNEPTTLVVIGHALSGANPNNPTLDATVAPAQPNAVADFAAAQVSTGGVQGFAVNDIDQNQVYVNSLKNDLPLPGVKVKLYYADGTTPVGGTLFEATSGTDGSFSIKNIPLWKYVLKVDTIPPGFISTGSIAGTGATQKSQIPISLQTADSVYAGNNFFFEGDATAVGVTGNVFGFRDANYIQQFGPDGGGTANNVKNSTTLDFPNLQVDLLKNGSVYLTQKTNANGEYRFVGIPNDPTYQVKLMNMNPDPTYYFMNDSDGKFGGRIAGQIATPVAGSVVSERNFWFGLHDNTTITFLPVIPAMDGSYYWGSMRGNRSSSGWQYWGTYRVFEEDGVTRATDATGVQIDDMQPNGEGAAMTVNYIKAGGVDAKLKKGIYRWKLIGGTNPNFSTGLLSTDAEIWGRNGLVYNIAGGLVFKGAGKISGRAYVEVNGVNGYQEGVDIPVSAALVYLRGKDRSGTETNLGYIGTNPDGTYEFTNLPNGNYFVQLTVDKAVQGGLGTTNTGTFPIQFQSSTFGATLLGGGTGQVPAENNYHAVKGAVSIAGGATITDRNIVYKYIGATGQVFGRVYLDIWNPHGSASSSLDLNASNGRRDRPVGGVKVTLLNMAGVPVKTAITTTESALNGDDTYNLTDGSFRFTGVAAGNYKIRIEPSIATTQVLDVYGVPGTAMTAGQHGATGFERQITVLAGANPPEQYFLVRGTTSFTPGAFRDADGNGMWDPLGGGYGISYALYKNNALYHFNWNRMWDVVTQELDTTFEGLEPGTYRLEMSRHLSVNPWNPLADTDPNSAIGTINFTVPASGAPATIEHYMIYEIPAEPSFKLSGKIYVDTNGNGQIDPGDMGYNQSNTIKLYKNTFFLKKYNITTASDTSPSSTISSKNSTAPVAEIGTFAFSNIPATPYVIRLDDVALSTQGFSVINNAVGAVLTEPNAIYPASMNGKWSSMKAPMTTAGLSNQDFLVKRNTTVEIGGRVFQDVFIDNQYNSTDDLNLKGTKVGLFDSTGTKQLAYQEVGGDGLYSFKGLPDATYIIKIIDVPNSKLVKASASPNSYTKAVSGTMTSLDNHFWYILEGDPGISGYVALDINSNGSFDQTSDLTLKNLTVTLTGPGLPGGSLTTTTNSQGLYSFVAPEIAIGQNYTVTVTMPTDMKVYRQINGTAAPVNTTSNSMTVSVTAKQMYRDRIFLVVGNTNENPGGGPSGGTKSGISGFTYVGYNVDETQASSRLNGVLIELSHPTLGRVTATTDATGFYAFHNLPEGTYKIEIKSPITGYSYGGDADGSPIGIITATTIKATTGNTTIKQKQNFWFTQLSVPGVSGYVYFNPAYGAGGTDIALSNMTVELYESVGGVKGALKGSVKTDATGKYHFPNIMALEYILTINGVEITNGGFQYAEPTAPVLGEHKVLVPSSGATAPKFVLVGIRKFEGHIWIDTDGDNTGDTGIQNVSTTLTWAGFDGIFGNADDLVFSGTNGTPAGSIFQGTGKTVSSGGYQYTGLPAGEYKISYDINDVALTGYALIPVATLPANTAPPRDITVVAATDTTGVDFTYQEKKTLKGRLAYDMLNDGTYQTSDPGLMGVAVTLYKTSDNSLVAGPVLTSNVAGQEGTFEFTDIVADSYYISIDQTHLGNYTHILSIQKAITSKPPTTLNRIEGVVDSTAASTIDWIALYGPKPGAGTSRDVIIKTRSDDNDNTAYDATDSAIGGIPVKVTGRTGAGDLWFGNVNTAANGNFTLTMPHGSFSFEADNSGVTPAIMAVYDSAMPADNKVLNYPINASSAADETDNTKAHIYFGYKGTIGGGYNITGEFAVGTVYAAANPKLKDIVIQRFMEVTSNSITSYVYVDSQTSAAVTGAFSFTGAYTNTNYKGKANGTTIYPAYIPSYGFSSGQEKTEKVNAANLVWNLGYKAGTTHNVDVKTLFDTNMNKNYDTAGVDKPAPNILITINEIGGAGMSYSQSTSIPGGSATFALPPGTYEITSGAPVPEYSIVYSTIGNNTTTDKFTIVVDSAGVVTYNGATPANGLYFGYWLKRPGAEKLGGRVVLANNGTSYQPTDIGINQVKVLVEAEGSLGGYGPVEILTTSGQGTYTSSNLQTGIKYQVSVLDGIPTNPVHTSVFPATPPGTINGTLTTTISNWHFGYKVNNTETNQKTVTLYTWNDSGATLNAWDSLDVALGNVDYIIESTDGIYGGTAQTDGTGKFVFNNLPYGTYKITGAAPTGFVHAYRSGTFGSNTGGITEFNVNATSPQMAVQPHEPYLGFKFTMPTGGNKISGDVFEDALAPLGAKHAMDPRYIGQTVSLEYDKNQDGNYQYVKSVQTNSNGKYEFDQLPDGKFRITVETTTVRGTVTINFATHDPSYDKDGVGTPNVIVGIISGTETDWDFGYKGKSSNTNNKNLNLVTKNVPTGDTAYNHLHSAQPSVGLQVVDTSGVLYFPPSSTDGANGWISYQKLPIGTYEITATTPAGLQVVYNSNSNTNSKINVTTTTTSNDNTSHNSNPNYPEYFGYGLQSGNLSISGRVVFDTNDNNGYDSTDFGLNSDPAKIVKLERIISGVHTTVGTVATKIDGTNGTGYYVFENLAAGEYKVTIDSTHAMINHLDSVWDKDGSGTAHTIQGTIATDETNWHFVYKEKATTKVDMTYRTRVDSNGNKAYDANPGGDAAEANVTIKVENATAGITETIVTNLNGDFLSSNIPRGSYTLTVTSPSTAMETIYLPKPQDSSQEAIPAGTNSTVFNATTATAGANFGFRTKQGNLKVSGYVVIDTINNGQYDEIDIPAGKPGDAVIKNVVLKVERETAPGVWTFDKNVTTDASGKYEATGLESGGVYRVSVTSGVSSVLSPKFIKLNTPSGTAVISGTVNADATDWHFGYVKGLGPTADLTFESYYDEGTTLHKWDAGDTAFGDKWIKYTDGTVTGYALTSSTASGAKTVIYNLPYSTYTMEAVIPTGALYQFSYGANDTTTNPDGYNVTGNATLKYGYMPKTGGNGSVKGRVVDAGTLTSYNATMSGINSVEVKAMIEIVPGDWRVFVPGGTSTTATVATITGVYEFTGLTENANYKMVPNPATLTSYDAVFIHSGISSPAPNPVEIVVNNLTGAKTEQHFGYKPKTGGFEISGRVVYDTNASSGYDGTDFSIIGVQLQLYMETAPGSGIYNIMTGKTATTGNDGKYTFTGLNNLNYQVKVVTPQTLIDPLDPVWDKDGVATAHEISGTAGTADWHFVYKSDKDNPKVPGKPGTDMTFRTRMDSNGDQAYDTGDSVYGNVTIEIENLAVGIKETIVTNATTGDFLAKNIPQAPGNTYKITVTIPDTLLEVVYNPKPVDSSNSSNAVTVNYNASGGANKETGVNYGFKVNNSGALTLSGHVVIDTNSNGAYDATNVSVTPPVVGDAIIKDAELKVELKVNGVYQPMTFGTPIKTDGNGYYSIPNLAGGDYRVSVISGIKPNLSPAFIKMSTASTVAVIEDTLNAGNADKWNFGYKDASDPVNPTAKAKFTTYYDEGTALNAWDGGDTPFGEKLIKYTSADGTIIGYAYTSTSTTGATVTINDLPYGNYTLEAIIPSGVLYKLAYNAQDTLANPLAGFAINTANPNIKYGYDAISGNHTVSGEVVLVPNGVTSYVPASITPMNGIDVKLMIEIVPGDWRPMTPASVATSTAPNALYSFAQLPDANYKIAPQNVGASYEPVFTKTNTPAPPAEIATTINGANLTGQHFGYKLKAGNDKISGRVVYDTNGNNNYDATDFSIIGVKLDLYIQDDAVPTQFNATGLSQITIAGGTYEFTGLIAGKTYQVKIDPTQALIAPLDSVWDKDGVGSANSITGTASTDWNFVYKSDKDIPKVPGKPGTDMTFRTRMDSNGDQAYDAGDTAYGSVTIEIENLAVGIKETIVTHTATGDFLAKNIPQAPGNTYKITVTIPDTLLEVVYNPKPVDSSNSSNAVTVNYNASGGANKETGVNYGFKVKNTGSMTLSGHVVIDTNSNTAYDGTNLTTTPPTVGDAIIKDAELKVERKIGGVYQAMTFPTPIKTDGNGYYSIALDPGDYRVSVINGIKANLSPAFIKMSTSSTIAVIEDTLSAANADKWNFGYKDAGDPINPTSDLTFITYYDEGSADNAWDAGDTRFGNKLIKYTSADGTIIGYAYTSANTVPANTTTGAEFISNDLPCGTYSIEAVIPPGALYQFAYGPNDAAANPSNFVAGAATHTLKIGYDTSRTGSDNASINGRVVNVPTGVTNYAATQVGMTGIDVAIQIEFAPGDWRPVTPTHISTTPATGAYSFTNLPYANYKIAPTNVGASYTAVFTKMNTPAPPAEILLTTTNATPVTDQHFGYTLATGSGEIKGRIVYDTNNNSTYDTSDFSIKGVELKLFIESDSIPGDYSSEVLVTPVVKTIAGGTYTFTGLIPTKNYRVQVIPTQALIDPLNPVWDKDGVGTAHIITGLPGTSDWNFVYKSDSDTPKIPTKPGTDMLFRTRLDSNGDKVYDVGDAAEPTVTITINNAAAGIENEIIVTDSVTGNFLAHNIPQGNYDLVVTPPHSPHLAVVYNPNGTGTVANVTFAANTDQIAANYGFKVNIAGNLNLKGYTVIDGNNNGSFDRTDMTVAPPIIGDPTIEAVELKVEFEVAAGQWREVTFGIPHSAKITDANGLYELLNIKDGNYRITVVNGLPAGLAPKFVRNSDPIAPTAPAQITRQLSVSETNWHFGFKKDPTDPNKTSRLDFFTFDDSGSDVHKWDGTDKPWGDKILKFTDGKVTGYAQTNATASGATVVIADIPYSTYNISTVIPTGAGYVLAYNAVDTSADPLAYVVNQISHTIKYGYEPDSGIHSISGRVVRAPATATSYLASYDGISGITMKLEKEIGGTWMLVNKVPAIQTNGTGDYTFTNLADGKYRVTATNVNSAYTGKFIRINEAPTGPPMHLETTINGGNQPNQHFTYSADGMIDGKVVFDVDGQGPSTSIDIGIPNVKLIAKNKTITTEADQYATTDGTGNYAFATLLSGSVYEITVDPTTIPTGLTSSFAGLVNLGTSITITAAPSMPANNGTRDFGYFGLGKIAGKAVVDENGNGVQDGEDVNGYHRVQVKLSSANGDPGFVSRTIWVDDITTPATTGEYKLENLVTGFTNGGTTIPGYNYKVEYAYVHRSSIPTIISFIRDKDLPGGADYIGTGIGTSVASHNVQLTSPTTPKVNFVVGLRNTLSIEGRITYDMDSSEDYTAGVDTPLPAGTQVKLSKVGGGTSDRIVTIDANGVYKVEGLSVGDWVVEPLPGGLVGARSYEGTEKASVNPALMDGKFTVTLNDTTPVAREINFGYFGTHVVKGKVFYDYDSTGAHDPINDLPIPGVEVKIYLAGTNTVVGTSLTDVSGEYVFNNLMDHNTAGIDYEIRITRLPVVGLQLSYGTLPIPVEVSGAPNPQTVMPIGYDGTLTIQGKVFHDANANDMYDPGEGAPAAGPLQVKIRFKTAGGTWTGALNRSVVTAANGDYELTGLIPGEYSVELTAASQGSLTTSRYQASFDYDDAPGATPVTPHVAKLRLPTTRAIVPQRVALTGINFAYVFGGSIESAVYLDNNNDGAYDAGDTGLPGVEVTLTWTGGSMTATTNAQGIVNFKNLDETILDYKLITTYGLAAGSGKPLAQTLFSYAGSGVYTDAGGGLAAGGDVTLPVDVNGLTTVTKADAYFGFKMNNQPVTITKKAGKDTARIGEFVPYTITVTNNGTDSIPDISVKDYMPAGFKYVKGSARYTNLTTGETRKFVTDPVDARPIVFEKFMDLQPGASARITYLLVVGAGVVPGDYVNKAYSINQFGFQNSNVASASVKVIGDPLFDDSLIFGKVFHDKNRNGRQDKDEPGVGGIKLVTARGEIITTDEHGRYHLADVSGGRWERGTNFILKLDTRSLPQGLTTTTENPIVVRLSSGLPSRINFGVEVPPPVAERLSEQLALAKAEEVKKIEEKLQKEEKFVVESIHFAFDQDRIEPEFENTLDSLAEVLRLHPEWKIRIEGHTDSLGTEAYNKDLSQRRANAVKAYLLKTGVNSAQLVDAVGLGLSEPVADNGTPEGRYKNRRVEFKLEK